MTANASKKRSSEAAELDNQGNNSKIAKVSESGGEVAEDFLWTPESYQMTVDQLKNIISEIELQPPTKDDQKIWYFVSKLPADYPIPDDKADAVRSGLIKYHKMIHLKMDEHATTTGLKIWEPTGNIANKSCSINFPASDLENMVLGIEYMCPVDKKMKRGLLLDRILDILAENPVHYWGEADEMLMEFPVEKRKTILAKRYAPAKSNLPCLITKEQTDKTDATKKYKPSMKVKCRLHPITEQPTPPIWVKADIERMQAESEEAVAAGKEPIEPKATYSIPYLAKDMKTELYEKNLEIARKQPDPCALLPQWSKMMFVMTLLGATITPGAFGINSRGVQFFRTALSSGGGGASSAQAPPPCHFMDFCRKPAPPASSAAPSSKPTTPDAPASQESS